jgi:hypothetical protein
MEAMSWGTRNFDPVHLPPMKSRPSSASSSLMRLNLGPLKSNELAGGDGFNLIEMGVYPTARVVFYSRTGESWCAAAWQGRWVQWGSTQTFMTGI